VWQVRRTWRVRGTWRVISLMTEQIMQEGSRSPDGNWAGVSGRVSVLVYNTSQLKPSQLPSSVMDLANPKWAGKLGIAPGETDFQPIITSIADTYGRAAALTWPKGVKANAGSHQYPDNETLTSEVNSGQVEIGLINHYYWYRLRAEIGAGAMHSALHYLANGDPGYVLDVSGAAVLASSTHKSAAQKFLAFLAVRYPGRLSRLLERFGYLIQGLPGLVIACTLMFFPLALAAPGIAASAALVFLSAVTELTATLVLVPTGVNTLATAFWAYQSEVAYATASRYAALIVVIAVIPGVFLTRWPDPGRSSRSSSGGRR
jgi:hypothetical protein